MRIKNRCNVELPFQMPRFITYHFLASAGVVAQNNEAADIWYFNNAISVFCAPGLLKGDTYHPGISLTIGNIWDMPFLEKEFFGTNFVKNCTREIIDAALEQGYYVSIWGIDDYYVEGKTMYKQRHMTHDCLICGAEYETKQYLIAAYDIQWRYRRFSTSQKGVIAGLRAVSNQGKYGELVAVRCNDERIRLDIPHIKRELAVYLNTPAVKPEENALGIHAFLRLSEYLELIKTGEITNEGIDRRIFQFMWEHKQCMLDRIMTVEADCKLSDEISTAYAPLVSLSDFIRRMYMKYCAKRNDQTINAIQEKMKQLIDDEAYLLRSLCEQI